MQDFAALLFLGKDVQCGHPNMAGRYLASVPLPDQEDLLQYARMHHDKLCT